MVQLIDQAVVGEAPVNGVDRQYTVRVRVRVIQMVFLLLCMAEPNKTTEKSTGKQPHGGER